MTPTMPTTPTRPMTPTMPTTPTTPTRPIMPRVAPTSMDRTTPTMTPSPMNGTFPRTNIIPMNRQQPSMINGSLPGRSETVNLFEDNMILDDTMMPRNDMMQQDMMQETDDFMFDDMLDDYTSPEDMNPQDARPINSQMPRTRQMPNTRDMRPGAMRIPKDRSLIPNAYDDSAYLTRMYPVDVRHVLTEVRRELDNIDYEGSFIYDAYPDKTTLICISKIIYSNLLSTTAQNEMMDDYECRTDEKFLSNNKSDAFPPANSNLWLFYVVTLLVFDDVFDRRQRRNLR